MVKKAKEIVLRKIKIIIRVFTTFKTARFVYASRKFLARQGSSSSPVENKASIHPIGPFDFCDEIGIRIIRKKYKEGKRSFGEE